MTVTHVVLFQFKASVKDEDVKHACAEFLALKTKCISAQTNTPYILSLKGGIDNSIENTQRGLTHGFVVEFADTTAREYYVNTDPVHDEFKKLVGPLIEAEKTVVLDFSDGDFNKPETA